MNRFEEKNFRFEMPEGMEIIYCGKRLHSINHSFGPYNRDTYLMVLVTGGEATLYSGGKSALLGEGCLYVMHPQSLSYYRCAANVPWSIKWVALGGQEVGRYLALVGITPENPYVRLDAIAEIERSFDRLFERFDRQSLEDKLLCVAEVYQLFAHIARGQRQDRVRNPRIGQALEYIEQHFDRELSVMQLAEQVGLDYNYFSSLFKAETGCAPSEMIQYCRIEKAKKLLDYTDKSIREIAGEVGFRDEFYFSRVFKKVTGSCPRSYRSEQST